MAETELYQNKHVASLYDIEMAMTEDIPFYLRLARQQSSMVLELACGTGRVLLPLAQAGIVVTGLDASEHMLLQADMKMAHLPISVQSNISLEKADVRDFHLANTFGMAFIAANSFCMLTSAADQEATIRNVHRHLARQGLFVVDLFDPDPAMLQVDYTTRRMFEDPEGRTIVRTDRVAEVDRLTQVKTHDLSYEVTGGGKTETIESRYTARYTYPFELQHLIRLCGFRIEAVAGDYEGAPFSRPGGKLIVVARKL